MARGERHHPQETGEAATPGEEREGCQVKDPDPDLKKKDPTTIPSKNGTLTERRKANPNPQKEEREGRSNHKVRGKKRKDTTEGREEKPLHQGMRG